MADTENNDFFSKVFKIVKLIPFGKVSTYGHIARAVGLKSSARMVGWVLNSAKYDMIVPCHRVVNRNGELTGKIHFATPTLMRELLEAEGITFIGDAVDIRKHLWVPDIYGVDDEYQQA